MDWLYRIITLLSVIAAILAWIAKLRWAKEYIATKDETIKAKEAQIEVLKTQIEGLKELTPPKVREYYINASKMLEEYIEKLKNQIREAQTDIEEKNIQIAKLQAEGDRQSEMLKKLEYERALIEVKAKELEAAMTRIRTLVSLEPVNFIKFLDDVIDTYEEHFQRKKKNIKIERLYRGEKIDCLLDKQRFTPVVLNLLENAIEAMPQGGLIQVSANVETDTSAGDISKRIAKQMVTLKIKDNGEGMSEEMKNKIFTPFFTTKEKGSGLGLAVVKKIVDEHRGAIKVDSQLGEGTTVTISLPMS